MKNLKQQRKGYWDCEGIERNQRFPIERHLPFHEEIQEVIRKPEG